MHEIVANQLWADDPPEVWATAQRLLADGYDRHEVLHMLASVVAGEVFEVMRHQQRHDIQRVRQALAALPGEWEKRRADLPTEQHQNRGAPSGRTPASQVTTQYRAASTMTRR